MRTTDDLLARVLGLPIRARARMARELIASLDAEPVDERARQDWLHEVEKRAEDVLGGKSVVEENGVMFHRIRQQPSSARREAAQATRGGRGRA